MVRGRFTAYLALGALVVLAGGAAAESLATTSNEAIFPAPLTNNPTAATALAKAVDATLGSSNFTMVTMVNQQGPGIPPDTSNVREHFVYQSPNRVEEQSPGITEITVGSNLYIHTTLLGTTGARWDKLKVTSAVQSGSGQATEWLHFLLHQADVQQRSNVFRLENVSTVPGDSSPISLPRW
jgi:hypothetical protein